MSIALVSGFDERLKQIEVFESLACGELLRNKFENLGLIRGKMDCVARLVFGKKCVVGPQTAVLEDKQRIDGAITIKFEQRWNLAEFLTQVEIFVLQKSDGGKVAAVDGLIDASFGNTIEAYR